MQRLRRRDTRQPTTRTTKRTLVLTVTVLEIIQAYIDAHPHDADVIAFRQALDTLAAQPTYRCANCGHRGCTCPHCLARGKESLN
jgi:lipopolysaccharide biosynthesis regulator YciM